MRFKLLKDYFGSAIAAWKANESALTRIGLSQKLTSNFVSFRDRFIPRQFKEELLQKEIKIITLMDSGYPEPLMSIPDPPIALYIKGALPETKKQVIAIVGTRKPTPYGKLVTETLTEGLVTGGFTIVSGMARGIDAIAHRTTLRHNGITIAVLGCGVDVIYPPEHWPLYQEIIEKDGSVISEVPPGHTVLKGLFPARNRIISGLSRGVVVTEGAIDSGSLITARYAAEQGKEVFAVPGPITSYLSDGPASLLRQGASVITRVDDILEELHVQKSQVRLIHTNDVLPEEKLVIDLLSGGELHFDEIVRRLQKRAQETSVLLTKMELGGIIRDLGNGKYGLK